MQAPGEVSIAYLPNVANEPDVPGQRRLKVRLRVNFRFSAALNDRTHGIPAGANIGFFGG